MFKENKYTRWYFAIIANAKLHDRVKSPTAYYESHHIIPKSIGGDNEHSNLVLLTAREHYVCHALLPRMCAGSKHKSKMVYAFMMLSKAAHMRKKHMYCGRTYARLKIAYAPAISGSNSYMFGVAKTEKIRAKISTTRKERGTSVGEKNGMYGKNHTETTRALQSEKKKAIMTDDRRKNMITANPRSQRVRTPVGDFDSLSAAMRYVGLKSKESAHIRIRRGEWSYL